MSSTPDDPLVARIRQHDTQALADYIDQHRRQLLAFIERKLGGALRVKLEPDDILQEVSADAVRSLHEYDVAGRDVFGWLCQIAERRIIDAHRHFFASQKRAAGREVRIDAKSSTESGSGGLIDLLVASMTTASRVVSRNEKEMKMLQALSELPEDQREALRMRYLEGLPSKDIAEKLGKTDGAVRVMLTRALAKLQTILGPDAAPRQ